MGAIVATANKISKTVCTMVKTKTGYNEDMIQINEPLYLMNKLKNMQKRVAEIQKQIDTCKLIDGTVMNVIIVNENLVI